MPGFVTSASPSTQPPFHAKGCGEARVVHHIQSSGRAGGCWQREDGAPELAPACGTAPARPPPRASAAPARLRAPSLPRLPAPDRRLPGLSHQPPLCSTAHEVRLYPPRRGATPAPGSPLPQTPALRDGPCLARRRPGKRSPAGGSSGPKPRAAEGPGQAPGPAPRLPLFKRSRRRPGSPRARRVALETARGSAAARGRGRAGPSRAMDGADRCGPGRERGRVAAERPPAWQGRGAGGAGPCGTAQFLLRASPLGGAGEARCPWLSEERPGGSVVPAAGRAEVREIPRPAGGSLRRSKH